MYNVVYILAASSTSVFDWIFFILARNKDNYKVSDELEIRPNLTMDCGVALDQLKKSFTYLRTIQNILMTCWLSGEHSLPFAKSRFSLDVAYKFKNDDLVHNLEG